MLRRLRDRLAHANVVAALALFIGFGGVCHAALADGVGAPLLLPTFVAGPVLSGGTLIWQDWAGLEALSAGGVPRSLLRGGTLLEVAAGGGSTVLDTGHALLGGQANGKLAPVDLQRGCLPLAAAQPPQAEKGRSSPAAHSLFAVSGPRLLIAVGPGCTIAPRDHGAATRLVAFDMHGRHVELVRRLSRRPLAVALAGSTIAVFDSITTHMARITILHPRAGAIAGHIVKTRAWPITNTSIAETTVQIDDAGNVSATELSFGPHFGGPEVSDVVFPAHGKSFQPNLQTNGPFSGLTVPARPLVALSDGRLAFLTLTEGAHNEGPAESVEAAPVTEIEVLDITARRPLAKIDIAPDNDVVGIALQGGNLTWDQQPVADVLGPPLGNSSLPTCEFDSSPTGPPILERADLTEFGNTPTTVGSSPTPVACTQGPAPP